MLLVVTSDRQFVDVLRLPRSHAPSRPSPKTVAAFLKGLHSCDFLCITSSSSTPFEEEK